ncbi:asparagine synthase (glutamine-hydrolyzing) [bacterium]|nr:asparagine synthase (glutamine-hydrolyzing) [bacterium]
MKHRLKLLHYGNHIIFTKNMCAINGIYAYHFAANPINVEELLQTRDHMTTRGPDGKGEWGSSDCRVGLGHRRLSIIDLSNAATQPMVSADGKLVITFNGEIYNYKVLRRELETSGYVFRSHSDTEVLLYLYAEHGEEMVEHLRGMFAFGIWDVEKSVLLLVRDPYGIKPLYYADDGWTIRFASQVKALIAGGKISLEPEPAGLAGFYLFGSIPEPYTMFQAIRALPAGSTMRVDKLGVHEPKNYYSTAEAFCRAETELKCLEADALAVHVNESLLDSVRHHLVADVPVGAFLSAGIDSSALVGLMRDAGQQNIKTVTLAFGEFRGLHNDEAPLAEQMARQYGTRHTTRIVTEEEFSDDLPLILEAMDQPTIDGINTWFVSKAARELGLKVAISGLGGDELFGGYPSFRDIPRWVRWLAVPSRVPLLCDAFRHAVSALEPLSIELNPKTAGLLKYGGNYAGAWLLRRGLFMPWELSTVMDPDMAKAGLSRLKPLRHINNSITPRPRSAFARVASLESALYMRNQLLRDTDWASMAHGLEVRVPLVDTELFQRLAPLLINQGRMGSAKSWLANSPEQTLPQAITNRAKTGFSTPIVNWQQQTESNHAWQRLPALSTKNCPWARRWGYLVVNDPSQTDHYEPT